MKEDDELSKREILNESFEMSGRAGRRRGIVKTMVGTIASIPFLSGLTGAQSDDYEVQNREIDPETAKQQVVNASSELLDTLADDDLVSEPYVTSFPYQQMDDPEALGGIERVQLDGDRENVLLHKPTSDGGRLTLRLPVGDRNASATYIPKDQQKRVEYYASGRKEVQELSDRVGLQATCDNYCTNYCCDNVGKVCTDNDTAIQEPCPNCWLGNCRTVGYNCETGCYYN